MAERSPDGQMTGGQCFASIADIYDVAGQIRTALIALQAEARTATGAPQPTAAQPPAAQPPQARPRAGANAPSQGADVPRSN